MAVERMVANDVGSLIVKQPGGDMVGFLTERDIMKGMRRQGCSLKEAKVSDIMITEPVVATLDDSVDYARDAMTKARISHLPVLDGNKLVGVMSFYDVAKACLREANFENSLLKRYIKNWPEQG
jgi:CBS domain-containing protein